MRSKPLSYPHSISLTLLLLTSFTSLAAAQNTLPKALIEAKPAPIAISSQEEANTARDIWNPLYTGNVWLPSARLMQEKQVSTDDLAKGWQQAEKWWRLTLRPEYFEAAQKDMAGLREIRRGDDWIISRFMKDGAEVQIIYGRSLSILVRPPDNWRQQVVDYKPTNATLTGMSKEDMLEDLKRKQLPADKELMERQSIEKMYEAMEPKYNAEWESALEKFVHVAFRRLFRFDSNPFRAMQPVKTYMRSKATPAPNEAYGVALADNQSAGWIIDGGITWWTNGQVILFDVLKFEKPPHVKGIPSAAKYIGGPLPDNPNSFSLFPPHTPWQAGFRWDMYYADPRVQKFTVTHLRADGTKTKGSNSEFWEPQNPKWPFSMPTQTPEN